MRVISIPVAVGFAVNCGELHTEWLTRTFCDGSTPLVPWYVLLLAPALAVAFAGVLARGRGQPVIFEATWISFALVSFGMLMALVDH